MQIIPIQKITSITGLEDLNKISSAETGNPIPFQSMFQDAIENVKTTNANLNSELNKLATGQLDDLHNLPIASTKATLSVQMLVQLRNKALDAYNEVMRISV
jgi:flagellar hook-basal body complex protein FliE